jgi:hypothetical protein
VLTEQIGIQELEKGSTPSTVMSGISWDNVYCWQVPQNELEKHWFKVEPFLLVWVNASAGEMSLADIKGLALQGLFQVFIVQTVEDISLVFFTEFVQYPQLKALRLIGCSGQKVLLANKFLDSFKVWASQNGATVLESLATQDSICITKRMGFTPQYTVMRMPL